MKKSSIPLHLFWLRRDLRLHDNAGLFYALRSGEKVLPIFIFDTEILSKLRDPKDARVTFIYREIEHLKKELQKMGSDLLVRSGKPQEIFRELLEEFPITRVYTNHDYEPYAIKRDQEVAQLLKQRNISFHTFKDQVTFEKDEIIKTDGTPYTVYTPYSRKWKEKLNAFFLKPYPTEQYFQNFLQANTTTMPSVKELGFQKSDIAFPSKKIDAAMLKAYAETRNFPGLDQTSHLGLHLRFGTVSIRELTAIATEISEIWLNELIWREFFMMILWHFPQTADQPFHSKYSTIAWRNDKKEFEKWCRGTTGYPFVDAGMRELNATGFMHNRVRMVAASFLCKHLLIDWCWGERYFAEKLLDFELASNVGNWQWAAGTGCDAAPYFRVFNPDIQMKKFDADLTYVKKWVPEYGTKEYPKPMVEHRFARERALKAYGNVNRSS